MNFDEQNNYRRLTKR